MNLATLRADIQTRIGDIHGQRYTKAQLDDAINFAIKNYCQKKQSTYTTVSRTATTDGVVAMPTDVVKIVRIVGSRGYPLFPSTKLDQDLMNPTWEQAEGSAVYWLQNEDQTARLVPVLVVDGTPDTGETVTVGYIQAPIPMADLANDYDPMTDPDTTAVDTRINPEHHQYLWAAAISWLLQYSRDTVDQQASIQYMQEFNSLIGFKE
jgi:hypothetical protein